MLNDCILNLYVPKPQLKQRVPDINPNITTTDYKLPSVNHNRPNRCMSSVNRGINLATAIGATIAVPALIATAQPSWAEEAAATIATTQPVATEVQPSPNPATEATPSATAAPLPATAPATTTQSGDPYMDGVVENFLYGACTGAALSTIGSRIRGNSYFDSIKQGVVGGIGGAVTGGALPVVTGLVHPVLQSTMIVQPLVGLATTEVQRELRKRETEAMVLKAVTGIRVK